jgi:hypothetical protein
LESQWISGHCGGVRSLVAREVSQNRLGLWNFFDGPLEFSRIVVILLNIYEDWCRVLALRPPRQPAPGKVPKPARKRTIGEDKRRNQFETSPLREVFAFHGAISTSQMTWRGREKSHVGGFIWLLASPRKTRNA